MFASLVLLFEFIYHLPAIMGILLLILAFGLPIYLAFEVNGWLILTMPFTLGLAAFVISKCEDYAYEVRKAIQPQADSRKLDPTNSFNVGIGHTSKKKNWQ